MKTTITRMDDGNTRISIPLEFRYSNGRKRIFFPEMPEAYLEINESIAIGIARAYRWQELLDKGEYDSPESLAEALGVHTSYVRRFLRLTLLAPPIVDAVFAGKAPWTLSLTKLNLPLPSPCPSPGRNRKSFSAWRKKKIERSLPKKKQCNRPPFSATSKESIFVRSSTRKRGTPTRMFCGLYRVRCRCKSRKRSKKAVHSAVRFSRPLNACFIHP